MINLDMFCICLNNDLINKVKRLHYIPVGVGPEKFSEEWLLDSAGINISPKNKFYGEYTFHFWFWKNMLDKIPDNRWVGFCAYRRFWSNKKNTTINSIYETALSEIPDEWNDYEAIEVKVFEVKTNGEYVVVQHNWYGQCESLNYNYSAVYHVNPSGWALEAEGSLDKFCVDLVDVDFDGYPELLLTDFSSSAIYEMYKGSFKKKKELSWSFRGCQC